MDGAITGIDCDQLRALMRDGREGDYLVVDVREEDEYRRGHIPGAHNVPLSRIVAGDLPIPTARQTVFYCLGGGRSARAAQLAVDRSDVARAWNLIGGIASWNGHILPRVPNLRVFGQQGTLGDVIRNALELEKGAQRLYHALADGLTGTRQESLVRGLADAEVGHARSLYQLLAQHEGGSVPAFEVLYEACAGDILESGEAFEDVAAVARREESAAAAAVLQLALEMELGAYDLYRSAATATEKPSLKAAFLGLAEHEKGHARALSDALAELTSEL